MIFQPVLLKQETPVTTRMKVIESLTKFRQEWQSLANGQSLLDVQASVGLILADIIDKLELTEQEKVIVLGRKLINQVDAFSEQKIKAR
jgi:hypothetical protein